jgi:tRNA/rRNA methyltransferase
MPPPRSQADQPADRRHRKQAELPPLLLADIRIVLVAPKGPLNVAGVVRASANFEAAPVYVVAPRCDPLGEEAQRAACTPDLPSRIVVVGSLAEALADTVSSVGFTRRAGAARICHSSLAALRAAFPAALPAAPPAGAGGIAALVFGREESGLTEAEVAACRHACAIPTSERIQPSMNLSSAVAVVLAPLYEERAAAAAAAAASGAADSDARPDAAAQPAAAAEIESLLQRLAAIAAAAGQPTEESRGGGGNHGRRRTALGHARSLLQRAAPTAGEARSMHGLAAAVQAALQSAGRGGEGGGE